MEGSGNAAALYGVDIIVGQDGQADIDWSDEPGAVPYIQRLPPLQLRYLLIVQIVKPDNSAVAAETRRRLSPCLRNPKRIQTRPVQITGRPLPAAVIFPDNLPVFHPRNPYHPNHILYVKLQSHLGYTNS